MTALHSQPYKDIIDRVVRRRLELGWSQEELARRLPRYARPTAESEGSGGAAPDGGAGQLQSFVSKFEQRQRRLDVIEFQHLCHVLGLRLCDVLPEHEWNGEPPPALVPLARESLIEERTLAPRRARASRTARTAEEGRPDEAPQPWPAGPALHGAQRIGEVTGHDRPAAADDPANPQGAAPKADPQRKPGRPRR